GGVGLKFICDVTWIVSTCGTSRCSSWAATASVNSSSDIVSSPDRVPGPERVQPQMVAVPAVTGRQDRERVGAGGKLPERPELDVPQFDRPGEVDLRQDRIIRRARRGGRVVGRVVV